MFKAKKVLMSVAGLFAFAGIAQAAPVDVELTELWSYSLNNNYWQEIVSMDASFADDGDGILEIGEKVTFSVTMDKDYWGGHNFDVCKIWVDKLPGIEKYYYIEEEFEWDFNGSTVYHNVDAEYKWKEWTDSTETFYYTRELDAVGEWGFAASVMCSSDLSTLTSDGAWDSPTTSDWNAWTPEIHSCQFNGRNIQGEDKAFKFIVSANVPEPATLSLLGLGLLSLAFFRRKRT